MKEKKKGGKGRGTDESQPTVAENVTSNVTEASITAEPASTVDEMEEDDDYYKVEMKEKKKGGKGRGTDESQPTVAENVTSNVTESSITAEPASTVDEME